MQSIGTGVLCTVVLYYLANMKNPLNTTKFRALHIAEVPLNMSVDKIPNNGNVSMNLINLL